MSSTPTPDSEIDEVPAPRPLPAWWPWLLVVYVTFLGAYPHHPKEYPNTSTRFFLIAAVVDDGTLYIDRFHELTSDTAVNGEHYYSNKAMGGSLVGVPVYWALRHLPVLASLPAQHAAAATGTDPPHRLLRWLVKGLCVSLPLGLLAAAMWRLATDQGAAPRAIAWMLLGLCLGTPFLVHASQYSGHVQAGVAGFAAYALLLRLDRFAAGRSRLLAALAAGLLCGLAVLFIYTAGVMAVTLTVYLLWRRPGWRYVGVFLAGGAACAVLLGAYNTACFGAPWSLSVANMGDASFAAAAEGGFLGLHLPDPRNLLRLLLSQNRGLLAISPVLLLGIVGWVQRWRAGKRAETVVAAVIVLAYLLLHAGWYGWHGGWAFGPRYLTDILPFIAYGIVFCPIHRWWTGGLFAVAAIQNVAVSLSVPDIPPVILNPLVEITAPLIGYGVLAESPLVWLGASPALSIAIYLAVLIAGAGLILALARRADPGTHADTAAMPVAGQIAAALLCLLVVVQINRVSTPRQVLVHSARIALISDHIQITGDTLLLMRLGDEQGAAAHHSLPPDTAAPPATPAP